MIFTLFTVLCTSLIVVLHKYACCFYKTPNFIYCDHSTQPILFHKYRIHRNQTKGLLYQRLLSIKEEASKTTKQKEIVSITMPMMCFEF